MNWAMPSRGTIKRIFAVGMLILFLASCAKPVVITRGAEIHDFGEGWYKVNDAWLYQTGEAMRLLEKDLDICRARLK